MLRHEIHKVGGASVSAYWGNAVCKRKSEREDGREGEKKAWVLASLILWRTGHKAGQATLRGSVLCRDIR